MIARAILGGGGSQPWLQDSLSRMLPLTHVHVQHPHFLLTILWTRGCILVGEASQSSRWAQPLSLLPSWEVAARSLLWAPDPAYVGRVSDSSSPEHSRQRHWHIHVDSGHSLLRRATHEVLGDWCVQKKFKSYFIFSERTKMDLPLVLKMCSFIF